MECEGIIYWKTLSGINEKILGGSEAPLNQLLHIIFTLVSDGLLDAVPRQKLEEDVYNDDKTF